MRQMLLVLVLVAASFLGGAFVNGPGLRWVQTQLLGSLGLSEGGEIAAVDLKTTASPERAGDGSRAGPSSPEPVRGPVAPMPALIADGETGPADASDPRPRRPAGSVGAGPSASPGASATASPPLTGPRASADAAPGTDRGTTPSRAAAPPAFARAAAPLDPSVVPAVEPSRPASPAVPAPPDPGVKPAVPDSLASLMPPSAPPPPAPPPPDSAPTRSPPPPPGESRREPGRAGGDEDWVALGRTMQALGISRFFIEGQPGGRVVFSCLIPLAGRQAVAQRFEAEGDDGFHAARAALRRVALWRATQN